MVCRINGNIFLIILVEYAPEIGGLGLDIEAVNTRLGVFKEVHAITGGDDQQIRERMDATFPFMPEKECYKVISVSKGK